MSSPRKKPRTIIKLFRITFDYGKDNYTVTPLTPDPREAKKAFLFQKHTGDRKIYHVRLTALGPQCQCKGFMYRGRCKHCQMLQDARMLD
jgi:hypothetical protein